MTEGGGALGLTGAVAGGAMGGVTYGAGKTELFHMSIVLLNALDVPEELKKK